MHPSPPKHPRPPRRKIRQWVLEPASNMSRMILKLYQILDNDRIEFHKKRASVEVEYEGELMEIVAALLRFSCREDLENEIVMTNDDVVLFGLFLSRLKNLGDLDLMELEAMLKAAERAGIGGVGEIILPILEDFKHLRAWS